jgi:Helix-turn-helix domain
MKKQGKVRRPEKPGQWISQSGKDNQCERVLAWLRRRPLTAEQARAHMGVLHLASRISDLRDQRYLINTVRVTVREKWGTTRVAKYVLVGRSTSVDSNLRAACKAAAK